MIDLRSFQNVAVFTGAGMSAETPASGLYTHHMRGTASDCLSKLQFAR